MSRVTVGCMDASQGRICRAEAREISPGIWICSQHLAGVNARFKRAVIKAAQADRALAQLAEQAAGQKPIRMDDRKVPPGGGGWEVSGGRMEENRSKH